MFHYYSMKTFHPDKGKFNICYTNIRQPSLVHIQHCAAPCRVGIGLYQSFLEGDNCRNYYLSDGYNYLSKSLIRRNTRNFLYVKVFRSSTGIWLINRIFLLYAPRRGFPATCQSLVSIASMVQSTGRHTDCHDVM